MKEKLKIAVLFVMAGGVVYLLMSSDIVKQSAQYPGEGNLNQNKK